VRIRGYCAKPKAVREQTRLGNTAMRFTERYKSYTPSLYSSSHYHVTRDVLCPNIPLRTVSEDTPSRRSHLNVGEHISPQTKQRLKLHLIIELLTSIKTKYSRYVPIPVATQSKAWFCGRSLAGIAGSNPARGIAVYVSVMSCQVDVSVSGWSLVQRSPTECDVSDYDREASIVRRPWPTGWLLHHEGKKNWYVQCLI
jgi:hypothetical protein